MRPSEVVDRGLDLASVAGPRPDPSLTTRPLRHGRFVTMAAPALLAASARAAR